MSISPTLTRATTEHKGAYRLPIFRRASTSVRLVCRPMLAHASTPRTRNPRHRALMPCPSSERLRPFRIGSIV